MLLLRPNISLHLSYPGVTAPLFLKRRRICRYKEGEMKMKKMLSWLGILAIATRRFIQLLMLGKSQIDHLTNRDINGGNLFVQEGLGFKDLESAYAQPGVMTDAPYMYDQAFKKGADTLILPGFKHGPFLDIISDGATKSNGSAVYIDGSVEGKESLIGLLYRADQSGF
ncbi:hypothetical protein FQA39_LY13019 [Lamprigera yunnana]|nr:hypothetical protein FQA39_LY13019 [Lamprigera yunnana]